MFMLLLAAAGMDDAALIAAANARLLPERPCIGDRDSTDITVCGRRRADRFRVPFIVHDAGDPRYEAVAEERHRLLHHTTPLSELSPFQVGGGMAGVTATVGGSGGATIRKPAP